MNTTEEKIRNLERSIDRVYDAVKQYIRVTDDRLKKIEDELFKRKKKSMT